MMNLIHLQSHKYLKNAPGFCGHMYVSPGAAVIVRINVSLGKRSFASPLVRITISVDNR